jgi:NADPH:quinone reductase-like Zn-dependent oxidoreductase
VIEKSTGVTNFEIGDEIYCRVPQEQMGTIAEFVAVNSELVAKSLQIAHSKRAGLPLVGLTQYKRWRV